MEDDDEESDEEEVHDYDKSNHSSSNNLQNTDKLSVEILEAIKSLGIVEKVGFTSLILNVFLFIVFLLLITVMAKGTTSCRKCCFNIKRYRKKSS